MISAEAGGGGQSQTYTEVTVTSSGLSTAQVDASDIIAVTGGGANVTGAEIQAPTADYKELTLIGVGNGVVTFPNTAAANVDFRQVHKYDRGSRGELFWSKDIGLWRGRFTP
ncbi:MAG: hypothetical protein GY853_13405 [PVC group bacterium]|nr:hypothetical protein [PVC group bacterium]